MKFFFYKDPLGREFKTFSDKLCLNPKMIAENDRFKNIGEIFLGGDHYKWRLMRSNGVDEYYITGNAPAYEKFLKFAEVLPKKNQEKENT